MDENDISASEVHGKKTPGKEALVLACRQKPRPQRKDGADISRRIRLSDGRKRRREQSVSVAFVAVRVGFSKARPQPLLRNVSRFQ